MDILEYPWISKDIPISSSQSLSAGMSDTVYLDINGYQWISIDVNGYPWISMDVNGFPWTSMDFLDFYGFPSLAMDIHGGGWKTPRPRWMENLQPTSQPPGDSRIAS